MRAGVLDPVEIPQCPIDVLMQQIVAACAAEPWEEDALYEVLRRAHPYRELPREEYDQILCLLADGIEASRGRYGSYLLRARVHGRMQSRRGARTIAVSNGGTIPDTALYAVIVQPEGVQIATLDEDFAIDSSAGDVILLGNTSWRTQRADARGGCRGGGRMQMILPAPFGGRINKAWGLALRKRFCRGFNFELQAAATDNGLNISLAEQHSFPLSDVFNFLTEQTVTELLEQASLDSPIFRARWRWDAGRSLQLLRFYNGKRIAPQVQRTRSDDLLASVFPQVAACQENIQGDIQIPDHPLIQEVMKDVLTEAMDLEGLIQLLAGIRTGAIRCLAVDSAVPSAFAHELLNANPYAFLDDAPLEERRARAVSMRGRVPEQLLGEAGRLDPAAIAELREECWPDIRDEHELHDLLCSLVVVPVESQSLHWDLFFERLQLHGRATLAEHAGRQYMVAAERVQHL